MAQPIRGSNRWEPNKNLDRFAGNRGSLSFHKLTMLVGRSGRTDVIDLYFLEKTGHDLLPPCLMLKNEGGLQPAVLSLILEWQQLDARPPWMLGPVDPEDLNVFVTGLSRAFAVMALPEGPSFAQPPTACPAGGLG